MAIPSPQASLTIRDAFERFAATVQPNDHRDFQDTKLQDVRDEAIKIERQLRARRTQRNLARLEPFLRGMEHYAKVLEVLCNGTPYLPWIWAPVKLMLMITFDSLSAFEKLIDAYSRIADMMPRIDRLESALGSDHNFQCVLALIYADILEFHRRAYKFVRRSSWHTFFASMWAGFETRFSSILAQLAYHSKLLDKESIAIDIFNATNQYKEQATRWEQQEREWRANKVRVVLSWLTTGGPLPEDALDRHAEQCLPNTCDWFIQGVKTQKWLKNGGSKAMLWLTGKPGAGKSILCSSLIQHAQSNAIDVFFYFCTYVDSSVGTSSRILRSLASQIVQKHQDLAIHVHDVFFQSYPVPTRKVLLCLLPELVQGLGTVRLVIDGVDECSASDQVELLKDMAQLHSVSSASLDCKILIASRDTLGISRAMYKKRGTVVTVSLSDTQEHLAINRSIEGYIASRLADIPGHLLDLDPDGSILDEVKQTLTTKSDGMFLWVRLVLDSLDTTYSPQTFRDVVNGLPSDLETLYERIYQHICNAPGPREYGGVPRIISWICCAQRPLLKLEFLQGLALSEIDAGKAFGSAPSASILDHCKPFVEERSDSTIAFVHFSVQEFFAKYISPQIIRLDHGQFHLSNACVVIIIRALHLLQPTSGPSQNLTDVASGVYRFLSYAVEFWIEHCLLFASSSGPLSPDHVLSRNLAKLYDIHHAQNQHRYQKCDGISVDPEITGIKADERLASLAHLPIHRVMLDALRARQTALAQACEDGKAIETFLLSSDRTLFSRLISAFDDITLYLLSHAQVAGIPRSILQAFQDSYASTAFRCRFPQCTRSSIGFASSQLQSQHEAIHAQRVYCTEDACQYQRIGFAKRAALNTHMRTIHNPTRVILIPAKIRYTKAHEEDEHKVVTASQSPSNSPPAAFTHRVLELNEAGPSPSPNQLYSDRMQPTMTSFRISSSQESLRSVVEDPLFDWPVNPPNQDEQQDLSLFSATPSPPRHVQEVRKDEMLGNGRLRPKKYYSFVKKIPSEPEFERTYTDIAADNFYENGASAPQYVTTPPVSQTESFHPSFDLSNATENLRRAIQAAELARSQRNTSSASRDDSPFRYGSPYREAFQISSDAHPGTGSDNLAFNSASHSTPFAPVRSPSPSPGTPFTPMGSTRNAETHSSDQDYQSDPTLLYDPLATVRELTRSGLRRSG